MAKRSIRARDEQGKWDIGGGGVELYDSITDTVIREVKEEYCADVLAMEFLGYRDVHREKDGVKTHWVALDFKVLVNPQTVKIGEPHKFDELKWFTLKNAPDFAVCHSQWPEFVRLYRGRL